jgi:GxxExxY protein
MEAVSVNRLSHELIGAAIEVHRILGPGLLESLYEQAYARELTLRGIGHVRQKSLPVRYKGVIIDGDYRVDVMAEDRVVVELKAVERMLPIFGAQVLTYLKLGNYPLGLLLNFNAVKLSEGIERITHGAPNLSAPSRLRVKKEIGFR